MPFVLAGVPHNVKVITFHEYVGYFGISHFS